MEVDPDLALEEFREVVKDALGPDDTDEVKGAGGGGGGGMGGMMGNIGLPDFGNEISEMISGTREETLTHIYISSAHFANSLLLYCFTP